MAGTGLLGQHHFRLDRQRAFIEGHGTIVVVYPCLQCPCLLDDRQFSPNCSTCFGTGRFYPPNSAYSTTLLLSQENSRRTFIDPGTWVAGDIRATVLPGVRLCDRDRVVMVDIRDTYADEILVKGLDERLRFSQGVELDIIADHLRIYQSGLDYMLSPPNTVVWVTGGNAPAFGAQYSCKYSAFPEFLVVQDSPRLRIEHRTPQAQEVVLRRLDKLSENF